MISVYRTDQMKRFAPSYLNHSFISSLNVKVCICFVVCSDFTFVLFFGLEVFVLGLCLCLCNVFCYQSEGGVKSLRTGGGGGGVKNFRTGGH